ncbi:hypothetical protein CC78DRAFT_25861 [Lojkania enalia]|uniref:Uncharacterized protein n=1 Tax=Lojkania enalia TaxID=147567 RepID=A0A9P4N6E8_9PLEO|nr:hypothetical protein CC78DRAFT_25861 [Didymosphaeria enalia]
MCKSRTFRQGSSVPARCICLLAHCTPQPLIQPSCEEPASSPASSQATTLFICSSVATAYSDYSDLVRPDRVTTLHAYRKAHNGEPIPTSHSKLDINLLGQNRKVC